MASAKRKSSFADDITSAVENSDYRISWRATSSRIDEVAKRYGIDPSCGVCLYQPKGGGPALVIQAIASTMIRVTATHHPANDAWTRREIVAIAECLDVKTIDRLSTIF